MSDRPEEYRCRHLFTDGRRCGSASLRHESLCYYHHTTRRPVTRTLALQSEDPAAQPFNLPVPENRHAVQCAIGEILQRIAANQIDPRRAAALLYGLSIASGNLPRPLHAKPPAKLEPLPEPETEVVDDPELGTLALLGEPLKPERNLDNDGQYLVRHEREKRIKAEEALAAAIVLHPDLAPPPVKRLVRRFPGTYQGDIFIPSSCFAPDIIEEVED